MKYKAENGWACCSCRTMVGEKETVCPACKANVTEIRGAALAGKAPMLATNALRGWSEGVRLVGWIAGVIGFMGGMAALAIGQAVVEGISLMVASAITIVFLGLIGSAGDVLAHIGDDTREMRLMEEARVEDADAAELDAEIGKKPG